MGLFDKAMRTANELLHQLDTLAEQASSAPPPGAPPPSPPPPPPSS